MEFEVPSRVCLLERSLLVSSMHFRFNRGDDYFMEISDAVYIHPPSP